MFQKMVSAFEDRPTKDTMIRLSSSEGLNVIVYKNSVTYLCTLIPLLLLFTLASDVINIMPKLYKEPAFEHFTISSNLTAANLMGHSSNKIKLETW